MGGPSLIDLPLPFVLEVPIRGPGRYLHLLFAWVTVFTGLVYVLRGLAARHFGRNLLPARGEVTLGAIGRVIRGHLRFERSSEAELATYNVLQRLSYTTVVFVLTPLMIWTGPRIALCGTTYGENANGSVTASLTWRLGPTGTAAAVKIASTKTFTSDV